MTGAPDSTAIDAAFLDRIRAAATDLDVFDGEVVGPDGVRLTVAPQRYILVHTNRGIIRPDRFSGGGRRRRKTFWVHAVGLQKRQVERLSDRVIDTVVKVRLDVPGWVCDPITHEASQPVQADVSVKPARYLGVDQFDLYASPAP